jgi:ribosomal 50S subunit-recycling heat shock protein
MSVKIGEVQTKVSGDVKKTDEVNVDFKVSYSGKLETTKFKLSEDLKKGDTVKITIEKV